MNTETRSFSVIGTSVPRVDGVDKVTGKARYTGDLVIPGMIEGKFLRSPYAHARIGSIDVRDAEASVRRQGVRRGRHHSRGAGRGQCDCMEHWRKNQTAAADAGESLAGVK
ncbi:MAG: hypothetical protein ACREX3_20840, partial [Gammaproteobacteria bacterium]